jgi:hypothetical protein
VPTRSLRIPSVPLAAGVPLPALCILHGGIAVGTRKATFQAKTPLSLFLVLGLLAAFQAGSRIQAPSLPVCAECLRLRRTRLTLIAVPFVCGLVTLVALVAAIDPRDPLLVIMIFFVVTITPVVAVFVAMRAQWGTIFKGTVTRDSAYVEFRDVSPVFASAFARIAAPTN